MHSHALQFGEDVRAYLSLTPPQLPSRYLYDDLGSALFDAICLLPWYAITRAETRLLDAHARDVFTQLGEVTTVVEFGPGNGSKLRLLLEAGRTRPDPIDVHLVDVSEAALDTASKTLHSLPGVNVVPHLTTYVEGLVLAKGVVGGRTLVAFLGSNIGNFDPADGSALLRHVRASLAPGDALLLGADLVKSEATLQLAYDDPLGVTAAFNRNILVRINRELGGNFNLDDFVHRAVWNAEASRVEMHLVARCAQRVNVRGAGMELALAQGDTIWTESSYKYTPDQLVSQLQACGFCTTAQWVDHQDGFALTLAVAEEEVHP
jgi:L-histidine Nalpha-methyltransferase